MRFNKGSARGQAAIEFILLGIVIVIALICITVAELGSDSPSSGRRGSVEFEQTRTGTVKAKYIDSDSSGKHYFITVENNGYEADHEVSLAEYNTAQAGADFPVVLTDSDSVKSAEAQEQADDADATESQAAESQRKRFNWWWIMNNQMLMNMRNHSD